MPAIPATLVQPTVAALLRGYSERKAAPGRGYIDASQLGSSCLRAIWYKFRWSFSGIKPARYALNNDRREALKQTLIAELRGVGVTLHTADPGTGKPIEYRAIGGHVGAEMDAGGQGFVESPNAWHVVTINAHEQSTWKALSTKALKEARPYEWAKVQFLMGQSGLDRAFYLSANKNTDELYSERVELDRSEAASILARATLVVQSPEPCARVNESPEYWACKMCNAAQVCHNSKGIAINCRTCLHSTPELDGNQRWSCTKHGRDLTLDEQRKGCDEHRLIPALIGWAQPVDGSAEENWVEYQTPKGTKFRNGAGHYSSTELAAGSECAAMIDSPDVQALRQAFPGAAVSFKAAPVGNLADIPAAPAKYLPPSNYDDEVPY